MKLQIFLLTLLAIATVSCDKLNVKPSESLVVPTTLPDFQGLMDNTTTMNTGLVALSEVSSDNYYVTSAIYNAITPVQHQRAYIWDKDLFNGVTFDADWNLNYDAIFYSNVVLDGLKNYHAATGSQVDYNNVKGQALFHRAYSFYWLSQEFATIYSPATANADLGIVLRVTSDLNVKSVRSNIQQTYAQIISDLQQAKNLLPLTPLYKTRPSKPAAYAMLARTYLAMQDYKNAFANADTCLQLYHTLIDYNTLLPAASYPFQAFNNEVIYHDVISALILRPSRAIVDSNLCKSYAANDLRGQLFLNRTASGTYTFKGSYNGSSNQLFDGIAVDELYLIRAECNARNGNTTAAMNDFNLLMKNRYVTGSFTPKTASSMDEALSFILPERRKELLFRNLRWGDLRRLNQDPKYAVTLSRTLNSVVYSLPPGDNRYTFQIPGYIIQMNGIQQNP